jgi:hypothetical protein
MNGRAATGREWRTDGCGLGACWFFYYGWRTVLRGGGGSFRRYYWWSALRDRRVMFLYCCRRRRVWLVRFRLGHCDSRLMVSLRLLGGGVYADLHSLANNLRDRLVNRAGVGLLFLDAEFRQHLEHFV